MYASATYPFNERRLATSEVIELLPIHLLFNEGYHANFGFIQGAPRKMSRPNQASGGSRKLGTGGGGATGGGGRLRQNEVLAVCTERSTGKSPPPLPYRYGSERGGCAPRPLPPLNPRLQATSESRIGNLGS